MEKYSLKEVTTRNDAREFLDFAKRLYRDEPNWICPLDQDIERRFDPKYNELLRNGEAIRWLALDTQGRTVGRIAAFYNPELAALQMDSRRVAAVSSNRSTTSR